VTQDVLDALKHQLGIRPADVVDALHQRPAHVCQGHDRGSGLGLPFRFDGLEHALECVDPGDQVENQPWNA
jgi:hypothetical protein